MPPPVILNRALTARGNNSVSLLGVLPSTSESCRALCQVPFLLGNAGHGEGTPSIISALYTYPSLCCCCCCRCWGPALGCAESDRSSTCSGRIASGMAGSEKAFEDGGRERGRRGRDLERQLGKGRWVCVAELHFTNCCSGQTSWN